MSRSGDATDHWPHDDADDAHYDLVQLGEELAHDSRSLAHRADHDAERDAEDQHSCIHTAAHLIDSYTREWRVGVETTSCSSAIQAITVDHPTG